MSTAQDRGWGPPPASAGLMRVITASGAHISVHQGIAPLAVALITDLATDRGRGFDPAQCGGYNPRYIAGTRIWSNHAWGVAIDLDWDANPSGSTHHTFGPRASQIAAHYGFRWGRDYVAPTPPDPMHFEYLGTPGQAAAMVSGVEALKASSPVVGSTSTAPSGPRSIPQPGRYEPGVWGLSNRRQYLYAGRQGDDVKWVQWRLGLARDGKYGAGTHAAVWDFQQRQNQSPSGTVGPFTWAALGWPWPGGWPAAGSFPGYGK
jgi:hypothetical protein